MKKFEIGKVYGIIGKVKVKIVTVSKNDICFNRVFESADGDFSINTNYEAEIVKIKKDKEGNEFLKSANTGGCWYAENLIDEAEFKTKALELKAAKEKAAKDEAERIANAPEMKFGSAIDFTELYEYIKLFTGHSGLSFENKGVTCGRNYWKIDWQSSEIAPAELGVFGKILSSCIVTPFNNQISKDRETGECSYWTTVHVSYQHKSGGSNGMELFTARFEKGTWIFSNN